MDFELVIKQLSSMKFRQAVWLFPIAYTLHVFEELPQFTNLAPVVLQVIPNRIMIFIFFTFVFTPAVCFNILFHAGATAAFGVYSPGLLTALTLYPPLFYVVTRLAFREGLITNRMAIISFVVAGAFHAADVSHNVFKAW